jgi:hypothetical protein
MSKLLILFMFLAATVARAETEVDAYGLGQHPPVPESWLKLDEDLSIRVRILNDASGELATVVRSIETLRVEVTLFGREGAADREVALICSALFLDAEAGGDGYAIKDRPCYSGHLSDATGKFVPLDFDLRFRPETSDPRGSMAVVVQIRDMVVDEHVSLSPTFSWQGGQP